MKEKTKGVFSAFGHFCRPLIICFVLLITLNGNLGLFCMTDNCLADSYHLNLNEIHENGRKSSLNTNDQYLCEGLCVFLTGLLSEVNRVCLLISPY